VFVAMPKSIWIEYGAWIKEFYRLISLMLACSYAWLDLSKKTFPQRGKVYQI
jgi:hypothetical protein